MRTSGKSVVRWSDQSSSVVRRMAALVDDIVKLLCGRAIYMTSPVLQPWLDLNAARAHVANDPGNRTSDVLATMAGDPPASPSYKEEDDGRFHGGDPPGRGRP